MDSKILAEKIKEMFIHQGEYQFRKIIEEFSVDDKFIGDYYNFIIFDDNQQFPTFYHVMSPFDIKSKKAPQHAIVWQSGEMKVNIDYTHYADLRTGIMDAIVLQSLGVETIESKEILFVGSGKIARVSVKCLKEFYPELISIHYINKRNGDAEFEAFCKELGITAKLSNLESVGKCDYIFCHTNTTENILTSQHISKIKQGCVITAFNSSSQQGELSDEFYNSTDANIVLDWNQNLKRVAEMNRAVQAGILDLEKVIYLDKFFQNFNLIDNSKKYSIFRFIGTPIQNLAVLKCLE